MKEGKCIMGEMRKDREGGVPNDVDGLIDHYRHEVRKGQEAYDQLLKELNMLRGTKQIVERLSGENQKMKKRAQEAETETILVKGIGINSPEMKAAKQKIEELHNSLERFRKENSDLYNRIAELIEANEKEVRNLKWIKDHDYVFLIDENKKLHKEVEELKAGNKKLTQEIDDRIVRARKAGM